MGHHFVPPGCPCWQSYGHVLTKSSVIPLYFLPGWMAVLLSQNSTSVDTVNPEWSSVNFIKTLQAKQGWWTIQGNQRQKALQKAHNRHKLQNTCMNVANQALSKAFHSVYYILKKTKKPFQPLLNYSICRSKTALQEVFIQLIVISLPGHYLANVSAYH